MHRILFLLPGLLLLAACRSPSSDDQSGLSISKARIGMSYIEVLDSVGVPDTVLHQGVVMDEFGNQTKTDEWYYSADAVIIMVNDTVNSIDISAGETRRRIQYIIDSARAAEQHP
jgi:hypothetical protein